MGVLYSCVDGGGGNHDVGGYHDRGVPNVTLSAANDAGLFARASAALAEAQKEGLDEPARADNGE